MLHPDPKVARGEISSEGWIGTGSRQMVEEELVQSGSSANQTASIRLGDSRIQQQALREAAKLNTTHRTPVPFPNGLTKLSQKASLPTSFLQGHFCKAGHKIASFPQSPSLKTYLEWSEE